MICVSEVWRIGNASHDPVFGESAIPNAAQCGLCRNVELESGGSQWAAGHRASQTPQRLDWKFRRISENVFGRNPVYGRQYLCNRDCLKIAREFMKPLGNSISIKLGNANLRCLLNHLSSRVLGPTLQ